MSLTEELNIGRSGKTVLLIHRLRRSLFPAGEGKKQGAGLSNTSIIPYILFFSQMNDNLFFRPSQKGPPSPRAVLPVSVNGSYRYFFNASI